MELSCVSLALDLAHSLSLAMIVFWERRRAEGAEVGWGGGPVGCSNVCSL